MRVANKTRYGLRILYQLAIHHGQGGLASCRDIAVRQGISEPTLEQLMVTLKKAGLVRAVRGRNGGYSLNREPELITLLEVIEIFEGSLAFDAEEAGDADFASHATTRAWSSLADALCEQAAAVTLADVVASEKEALPEFVI
jgi:Rrf2 family protein